MGYDKICFSAVQVPKFLPIGEDYRLDLSKVVAYADYTWLSVEPDENGEGVYYSDSYALEDVGGGLTIWFEDAAGNIKVRNIVYTLSEADLELREFADKMVNYLDAIFVNQNEVSIILPALNEEVRRVRPEEYIKLGNLRVSIKNIQAYWREEVDIVDAFDILKVTTMVIPEELTEGSSGMVRVLDLTNITENDSSKVPMMFVELDKPRDITPDRTPTIIPLIYQVDEEKPKEFVDRQFARLDSILLKSPITMPEHFENKEENDEQGSGKERSS